MTQGLFIYIALTPSTPASKSIGLLRSLDTKLAFSSRSKGNLPSPRRILLLWWPKSPAAVSLFGYLWGRLVLTKYSQLLVTLSKASRQTPGFPKTYSLGSSISLVHKMQLYFWLLHQSCPSQTSLSFKLPVSFNAYPGFLPFLSHYLFLLFHLTSQETAPSKPIDGQLPKLEPCPSNHRPPPSLLQCPPPAHWGKHQMFVAHVYVKGKFLHQEFKSKRICTYIKKIRAGQNKRKMEWVKESWGGKENDISNIIYALFYKR